MQPLLSLVALARVVLELFLSHLGTTPLLPLPPRQTMLGPTQAPLPQATTPRSKFQQT
jgi:hypothetical protein